MKPLKYLEGRIRGWLPKESSISYVHKPSKPNWKPYWKVISIVAVLIVLSSVAFVGVRTYLRYSDPKADVTASYFEKTVNCSTASIGDIVEVNVLVYWHGYVIPEFKRDVKIVDPFPENNFILASESNVYESSGYGGSYQFKYLLKVIGEEAVSTELPKPRLYLDNAEISLKGTSATLNILSK
jgi:hypothetical protein